MTASERDAGIDHRFLRALVTQGLRRQPACKLAAARKLPDAHLFNRGGEQPWRRYIWRPGMIRPRTPRLDAAEAGGEGVNHSARFEDSLRGSRM
jgi:hypothetical protein